MKHVFTLSFLLLAISVFAQQRTTPIAPATGSTTKETPAQVDSNQPVRTAATSSQMHSQAAAPLPYDVNDKYMGRGAEFLSNLTVSELPSDFPVYEKQWSLKEYNQVVLAFYYNHLNIVNEKVKLKLSQLEH